MVVMLMVLFLSGLSIGQGTPEHLLLYIQNVNCRNNGCYETEYPEHCWEVQSMNINGKYVLDLSYPPEYATKFWRLPIDSNYYNNWSILRQKWDSEGDWFVLPEVLRQYPNGQYYSDSMSYLRIEVTVIYGEPNSFYVNIASNMAIFFIGKGYVSELDLDQNGELEYGEIAGDVNNTTEEIPNMYNGNCNMVPNGSMWSAALGGIINVHPIYINITDKTFQESYKELADGWMRDYGWADLYYVCENR
jgi:hypothetical protein